jgi:hypothetical protein
MSKTPKIVAAYGDPKKPKRWAAKRIRREFAREILEADREPLEAQFRDFDSLMEHLGTDTP